MDGDGGLEMRVAAHSTASQQMCKSLGRSEAETDDVSHTHLVVTTHHHVCRMKESPEGGGPAQRQYINIRQFK